MVVVVVVRTSDEEGRSDDVESNGKLLFELVSFSISSLFSVSPSSVVLSLESGDVKEVDEDDGC